MSDPGLLSRRPGEIKLRKRTDDEHILAGPSRHYGARFASYQPTANKLNPKPTMSCFIYIAKDDRLRDELAANGRITDALPSDKVRVSQVAVVSWQGDYLDALAVLRTGGRVASYKTRRTISDVYEFKSPVPVSIVTSVVDEAYRAAIADRLMSGGQLSSEAAEALREALFELRPDTQEAWARLEEIAARERSPLWVDDHEPVVVYERDAVGLALSAAGFEERNKILSGRPANDGIPFLEGLDEFRVGEDAILAHDTQVFGDWDALRPAVIGITRFAKGGRELTIVNANRTKIEQTLGVDLLYYIHDYKAYVLVQYKRLRKDRKDWEFRPSADRNFSNELERMRAIAQPCRDHGAPEDHRLGDNFCFIKFCKSTTRRTDSPNGELSDGMYLPLDYFDKLVASGRLRGPQGGVVLRYDNAGKWMTNRTFISLVGRAWVGTRGLTSAQVTELVKRALDSKHTVILAAGGTSPPG